MDAAADIGRASKENSSCFLDHFHVVYWFKSQETFWNKKWVAMCSDMDSKFQATLLKKSGNIYCSCRGSYGIMKFPLAQHSLWYDEQLFSTFTLYTLLNSSSGCFEFRDLYFFCSWWREVIGLFSLWRRTFFRAQTSLHVVLSTQRFKAAVRWPEEPALVNQRCQIKPLLLPLHFQLTWPAKKMSEVRVHRLLTVKLKGNRCFLLLAVLC